MEELRPVFAAPFIEVPAPEPSEPAYVIVSGNHALGLLGHMGGGDTTKVLIVEDDALVRFVIREFVEDHGYDVLEAGDADAAIAALENDPDIRLVITDINMPGSIDGLMLARTIRNRWPPVELIVTSGRMRPEEKDLPDRARFLDKPFLDTDLTAILQAFFPTQSRGKS